MEEGEAELRLHLLVPSNDQQKLLLLTMEQVAGLGLHRPIFDLVEGGWMKATLSTSLAPTIGGGSSICIRIGGDGFGSAFFITFVLGVSTTV